MSDLVAVIIPAGGSGVRLGSTLPKALVQIAGKTLVEHAVNRMAPIASQIIVAAPLGFEDEFRKILGDEITIVTGGVTRTESVKAALTHIDASHDFVLIHDAARALAPTSLAMRVIDSLRSGEKAVVPGVAVSDTIKRIDKDNYVTKTPTRSKLRAIQTPQGFKRKVLIAAHRSKDEMTDDAGLVEERGVSVKVITGEPEAFKITTPDDLALALKYLVGGVNRDIRAGVGTDAHAFSSDTSRPLWLAGINWEGEVGVDGHSDGDVAAHAICDALLSAASLGDLGSNFGTDRPEYAGASGAKLLQETLVKISDAGFSINNVSVQIVGNRPKIGARRAECISALSTALGGAAVSVSATTTDGLGFTGEGKGLSAIATALIIRSNK